MTTPANPLIAPRVDSTKPFSGIFILEDLDTIRDGVESNSWIEQGLGGIAFGLDALSAIANPLDAAASWATAYMIEHIQPLSDALEALAGDADQIEAFARTWDNVSKAIKTAGEALRGAIDRETLDWTGSAAEAYRQHMNEELGAMVALVKAADLLGTAVKAGGLLIAFVRQLVRDQIALAVGAVVGALPVLLAEEGLTLGLATPAVIAQVGILLLKWIKRVEHDLSLLIKSLRNLGRLVTRLDEVLKTLVSLIKGLAREKPHGAPHPPRVEPPHLEPPHVEPPHVEPPPLSVQKGAPWVDLASVKPASWSDRAALKDLGEHHYTHHVPESGTVGIARYDAEGNVTLKVFRADDYSTPVWEGVIGKVDLTGLPGKYGDADFGTKIEARVNDLVSQATGQAQVPKPHGQSTGPDFVPQQPILPNIDRSRQ
jgi:uncharacterized protein YukE